MSRRRNTDIVLLILSIISFFIMSVSFLLMPFGTAEDGQTSLITYASGGMFWVFLMLGTVFQAVLSKRRKDWYIYHRIKRNQRYTKKKTGIISFFKNAYGIVSDVLFILALIGLTASVIIFDGRSYVCYVAVFLTVFTFCLHCIFNGKIFYHIKNQDAILNTIEKERNEHIKESV